MNVWRKSRGNRFWFELARGSSWRGFELSGVDCIFWLDAPDIILEMLYTTYYTLRGISRHLRISTKGINYQKLKAGLNTDKFATFWMLPKRFYHSLVLQMTFIHFTTGWTQVDLSDFEKKNMKACETVKHNAELFLSSKLLPRKQRNSSKDFL